MADNTNRNATQTSPGRRQVVLTPGASDFTDVAKCIEVVAAGNLTYIPVSNLDAATITVTAAPVGWCSNCAVRRLTAATATVVATYDS